MKYTDLKEERIYKCWFCDDGYWNIQFYSKDIAGTNFRGKGFYTRNKGKQRGRIQNDCNLYDFISKATRCNSPAWKFKESEIEDARVFGPINNSYDVC